MVFILATKSLKYIVLIILLCITHGNWAAAEDVNILLNSSNIDLDPTSVPNQSSLLVSRHLNCQLFRQRSGYEIVPEAVKEFKTSHNGKIIRMTLKDDVHFVNGQPVTSKDVKDTFDYVIRRRPSFRNVPMWIDRIETESDKEFSIILKRPSPMLFRAFSAPNFAIFSSEQIRRIESGLENWDQMIGCGEYKISYWKPDEHISLVPANNQQYPKLNFSFFNGDETYLRNHLDQYDVITLYYPPDKTPGFKKARYYDPYILFAAINSHLNTWKTKENRCAAFSKINPKLIMSAFGNYNVKEATDIVPSGVLGYDDHSSFEDYLSHATPPKISALKLMIRNIAVPPAQRKAVENAFSQLSDRVESIVLKSGNNFADEFRKSRADFIIMGLKMAYAEAYEVLQIFLDSKVNPTGYVDQKLIKKIYESQFVTDSQQRSESYKIISNDIKGQCLIFPILQMADRYALIKNNINLPGLGETALNEYFLGNIFRTVKEQGHEK